MIEIKTNFQDIHDYLTQVESEWEKDIEPIMKESWDKIYKVRYEVVPEYKIKAFVKISNHDEEVLIYSKVIPSTAIANKKPMPKTFATGILRSLYNKRITFLNQKAKAGLEHIRTRAWAAQHPNGYYKKIHEKNYPADKVEMRIHAGYAKALNKKLKVPAGV